MVATDGHRLAHIERIGESLSGSTGEKKTLIPRKALGELQSLLANGTRRRETIVDFADDDTTLFFRMGGRVLTSRKLTGQFPNYEAVLPRDNNKFVIVRSEDLMGALQRVAQFADERSGAIKIRLEQNELRISSSSTDAGESEDIIETPYNYDPLVVGFNSAVPDRLFEGDREYGRGAAGVQGCAVCGADAAGGWERGPEVPVHPDADADLRFLFCGSPALCRALLFVGCLAASAAEALSSLSRRLKPRVWSFGAISAAKAAGMELRCYLSG